MQYLDRAIVIVLETKRRYFVTPSVNSTCFLQFGQNMLSKSELLSLSEDMPFGYTSSTFYLEWDLPKVSTMTCLSWSRTVEMKWTMNLLQVKNSLISLGSHKDTS